MTLAVLLLIAYDLIQVTQSPWDSISSPIKWREYDLPPKVQCQGYIRCSVYLLVQATPIEYLLCNKHHTYGSGEYE